MGSFRLLTFKIDYFKTIVYLGETKSEQHSKSKVAEPYAIRNTKLGSHYQVNSLNLCHITTVSL